MGSSRTDDTSNRPEDRMSSLKRAPHVLVAEPAPSELGLILEALRHDPSVTVSVGRFGSEVIEVLKNSGRAGSKVMPSVLLLDLDLENPSAFELIRKLRTCAQTRCLPIVALSRSSNRALLAEAYEAGANSCLVKPESGREFEETIARVTNYWLNLNQLPYNLGAGPAAG